MSGRTVAAFGCGAFVVLISVVLIDYARFRSEHLALVRSDFGQMVNAAEIVAMDLRRIGKAKRLPSLSERQRLQMNLIILRDEAEDLAQWLPMVASAFGAYQNAMVVVNKSMQTTPENFSNSTADFFEVEQKFHQAVRLRLDSKSLTL